VFFYQNAPKHFQNLRIMKVKQFIVSSLFFILSSSLLFAQSLPFPFKILPQPHSVVLSKGKFLSADVLKNIVIKGAFKCPVLGKNLGSLPISANVVIGSVTLILDKDNTKIPNTDGYLINVTLDGVQITGRGEAGLFYGCQSLEQLIEDANEYKKPIPACTILDYPAMTYRAVHFDVKHHLDHMNYYYESIDRLARYKINAVVFEFEDKLRYQLQALVAAPQAISIDEMAALTKYARERHIEITPLVQGLGHATFILKHDKYAHLRELKYNTWAFCPKEEGTYKVLFDLYSDAIKATPGSKYLHIGGDEIGNIGLCPRCKPTADKDGMMSLNLEWLKRVCAFAKENNRIPIFWDDMPFHFANLYESTWNDQVTKQEAKLAWQKGLSALDSLLLDFPKNCVFMRWNYSMAHQPGNVLALDWYQKHGLKAMIATAVNSEGGVLFQQDEREKGMASTGIIVEKSFIELAADKNISGMLCTAWDDKSPHMENYWRGFIAAAEYSWSPNNRSLNQFDEVWLQKEFNLKLPEYKALFDDLRKGTELFYEAYYKKGSMLDDHNQLQSMKRVEHWLKPEEGTENRVFDYSTKLIELPDLKEPGAWTNMYREKLTKAEIEINNSHRLENKLKNIANNAKKNKYYWQLLTVLYKLQNTSPQLLVALKQCDNQDKAMQKNGKMAVEKALLNFENTWKELLEIYSKTRFTDYPCNYVPDRYFHLASQAEDLSWMVQAQEIYHKKLKDWLKE
jgi:hexosaminidase